MDKNMLSFLLCLLIFPLLVLPACAQSGPESNSKAAPVADATQEAYHQQITGLIEELKNAKTPEQRNAIHARVKQAREQYRAAHPVKEPTPAEIEERRQKMEEMLKKDPFQWEMYQLRRSMSNSKTPEERESIRAKIKELQARHVAEEEAKLTPEQKAERQAREAKSRQMRAELKPLMEQLRAANTPEEHNPISARMREIFEKYK